MTEPERFYLSEADLATRHEQYGGDDSSCDGGRYSAPCGGCGECIAAQIIYGFAQERRWADIVHAAGLELANPSVIDREAMPHSGPSHDAYACWRADEVVNFGFPWLRGVTP